MNLFTVILALATGAALTSTVVAEDWIEMGPSPIATGPYTGRTSAIVASSTNPDKYYVAGADGGVWRTLDGGQTWTPLTDDLPICAMGALAIDPDDDNIIYAGSGEANYANHSVYGLGLYKSTDGGDTWKVLAAETFAGRTFARLMILPTDNDVLYAAIGHAGGFPARAAGKGHPLVDGPVGIFKSVDAGVNWTQLLNGIPNIAATDVVVHPTDGDTVYAAIGDIFGKPENGIYRSKDGGDSFKKMTSGLPTQTFGRVSLAISPSNPRRLYTIITNKATSVGGGATTLGVYRSDDGGKYWVRRPSAGNFQATYGWYLSTAIVGPDDPDICFVGGLTLRRTTDAGDTFLTRSPPHVDMHGLAFDAAGRLLCASDGGLHRSANLGDSWVALNDGLGVIQFYAGMSAHPTNPVFLLGGTQDNGTNRREGEEIGDWTHRLGGDGGYTALNRRSPNFMFAESQGTGNLYRSDNGGDYFTSKRTGINSGDRNCFLPPVTYDPEVENRLLYATHRIYESVNNGDLWTPITPDLTGGGLAAIRALVFAPSNSQTVYCATNDGRVLVSTDSGRNWDVKITGNPGRPRISRELAVDPEDDSIAYLAVGWFGVDQVLETTDRGDTWNPIDGDLPDVPVSSVAVERVGEDRIIYVGTDHGVYRTENGGVNWIKHGEGMPNSPVIDLVADTAHDRLIAVTQGRGVWYIPLSGINCDAINKFKVKCKEGKLKGKIKSDLAEGTVLTLTNNGGDAKEVTLNTKGNGKAKWRDQAGAHDVCIVECDRCKSVDCG